MRYERMIAAGILAEREAWEREVAEAGKRLAEVVGEFRTLAADGSSEKRGDVVRGWILFAELMRLSAMSEGQKQYENQKGVEAIVAGVTLRTPLVYSRVEQAHHMFARMTFDVYAEDMVEGDLLYGLAGEQLEKAQGFCEAMHDIGWVTGDVDEMFPLRTPSEDEWHEMELSQFLVMMHVGKDDDWASEKQLFLEVTPKIRDERIEEIIGQLVSMGYLTEVVALDGKRYDVSPETRKHVKRHYMTWADLMKEWWRQD